ncbi:unnamed protein product [Lupinus luteus]|uniref:CRM domain-containing protein n=1 Tax=Lupinus luteus TaxID=3873 RepID=A0AAV1WCA9_LUPLU
MAFQPFSLKLSSSSSSSSPYFIVLQPQTRTTFKLRVSSSQFDTQPVKLTLEAPTTTTKKVKKKKSSSRPSFFHQIQDKWSQKLVSQREKFPWEEEQPNEQEEEKEQEQEILDKSSAMNFQFPKRLPPWPQSGSPINSKFDFETESDAVVGDKKHSVGGSVNERKRIVKESSSSGEKKSEHKSSELNFQFPNRLSPWAQASNPIISKFGFETETDAAGDNDKPLQSSFDGVVERKEIVKESYTSREEKRVASNYLASQSVRKRSSNTRVAENSIPEHELRRLRNVALRTIDRFQVGVTGISQELVASIHEKWRDNEVVKLKFGSPLSANMRRVHHLLESRTGGVVVWRSGSSIVLYRGMTYKLPCVELYNKMNHAKDNTVQPSVHVGNGSDGQEIVEELFTTTEPTTPIRDSAEYLKDMNEEELMELSDLNNMLDELGPRYKDWTGREPLPVDADLLPAVVPGYKTPFRVLPYGVRHCLGNKVMTKLRRLSRLTAPHFALGRSRELQGLARAMVKLWETSAIAKIAIKRGVAHTRNEIMAEELRKLTGGTLLSRNKEYIVFYRGNDFLPPAVTNVLLERKKLTLLKQDEEEEARRIASSTIGINTKASKAPLVAGTLSETKAATTNWGHQPSKEEVEKMMRDKALDRLASFIRNLEKRLELAKAKFRKAEKAIAKLQGGLEPADLPTDLETLTNEERFLFRKIGLSMKPFLLLGKRAVYAGTIENMHLHWKYRELVKIIVKGKHLSQVKHIAIALEAESGGVLVSVDKDNKGYIIILYRGKNYFRPLSLRPKNLLTRRKALARSVELQRREALKHHISDLKERIGLLKSELEDMKNGKEINGDETLYAALDDEAILSDDDSEESEETEIYSDKDDSGSEDEKNQNEPLDSDSEALQLI